MNWYEKIPVMINNHGDPMTSNQIANTVVKLKMMNGYNNAVGICTKAVPSEKDFIELEKITESDMRNLFLSYSLTGLNEGGYSFEEREEVITRMFNLLGRMTIILRPLIKGRNDSHENIERIVKLAAKLDNRIVLGGLHNRKLLKQLKDHTKNYFIDCCVANGVKFFNKTSCVVADQFGTTCKVHDLGEPKNLNVLDMLGYKYELWKGKLLLEQATMGDLNFIRYITESLPYTKILTSNLNRISTIEKHNYELTSGWLSWSNNLMCSIACDYCVMSLIDYLADGTPVGCHPKDLQNIRIDNSPCSNPVNVISKEEYISYYDNRVPQDCMKYDQNILFNFSFRNSFSV